MKIAVLFCLVFGVAVAVEPKVKAKDNNTSQKTVSDCYDEEYAKTPNADCPNYDRMIDCFKALTPIDDDDRIGISESIKAETELRDKCPALVAKGTCLEHKSYECMKEIYQYSDFQCHKIPTARKCLEDLNSICGKNVTNLEMAELDYEQWACDHGEHKVITDIDTHSKMKIEDCYIEEYNKINDTRCLDYEGLIQCLRRLSPANDDEKMVILEHIRIQTEAIDECPALLAKGTCIQHERIACMDAYYDTLKKGDNPCPSISVARKCLLKLDAVCGKSISKPEMADLDHEQKLCDEGFFGHGACSENSIVKCTAKVFNQDKGGVMNCEKKVVDDADKCLMEMKSKCDSTFIQNEISDALYFLVQDCASDFDDDDYDEIFG